MTACIPSLCTTWVPERDEVFFRIVQGLFSAAFLEGAEVLLASFDDEQPSTAVLEPAAVPVQRRPALVPAQR